MPESENPEVPELLPAAKFEDLPYDCQLLVLEYLLDLDWGAARLRLRMVPSTAARIKKREDVQSVVAQRMADRAYRVQVSSDDVLRIIWSEIQALRTADDGELFAEDGSILPVTEWPDEYRRGLVAGYVVENKFERSHDGTVADAEGRSSWDKSGKITKIKIAPRKKVLLEFLELAMRHTSVSSAFVQPKVEITVSHVEQTVVNLAAVCTIEQLEELRRLALTGEAGK